MTNWFNTKDISIISIPLNCKGKQCQDRTKVILGQLAREGIRPIDHMVCMVYKNVWRLQVKLAENDRLMYRLKHE